MLGKKMVGRERARAHLGQHDPMRGRHLFAGRNIGLRQTIFGDHRRSAMTLGRK